MAELVIGGFHRSGTSLLAQLLHRAGLFLGEELLAARPSNPYGHYEDVEAIRLHEGLLADNGRNWHLTEPLIPYVSRRRWRQMSDLIVARRRRHRLWGFKDPRACVFLPLWKHLLPEMKVIIVYRHFAESVHSLERRHSGDLLRGEGPTDLHRLFWDEPDHGLKMWLAHNQALVTYAFTYPRDTAVVSFDQLRGGLPVVSLLERRWDVGLTAVDTFDVFDPSVTTSRSGKQPLSDRRAGENVLRVWRELERLSAQSAAVVEREALGA